jgi:hypothetical protein
VSIQQGNRTELPPRGERQHTLLNQISGSNEGLQLAKTWNSDCVRKHQKYGSSKSSPNEASLRWYSWGPVHYNISSAEYPLYDVKSLLGSNTCNRTCIANFGTSESALEDLLKTHQDAIHFTHFLAYNNFKLTLSTSCKTRRKIGRRSRYA